jgi:enterochelin esterase-like enzyme
LSRLALTIAIVLVAGACARGAVSSDPLAPSPTATSAGTTSAPASPSDLGPGRSEQGSFRSAALNRTLRYIVYLPPGYDANTRARYPTAYLLHGGSGFITEWMDYGLFDWADRLMRDGTIPPFLIVLPEGDQEYWVDHVIDRRTGANGEKWGTYTAKEVVPTIDGRYRTIARPDARAIGGLSMGGHAAMQLPLSFPGIWSVIGATSPSLRPEGDAPTYLGFGAEFAARDPLALIQTKPDLARAYSWWLDAGNADPWAAAATRIHEQLTTLGIAHEWHLNQGDHSAQYWSAHVPDYLRYYAKSLCKSTAGCPQVP